MVNEEKRIGARYMGDNRCEFTVWAPHAEEVEVKLLQPGTRTVPMKRDKRGYWRAVDCNVTPGTLYLYVLDKEKERPDPASCSQPRGVHEASQVIDQETFVWSDVHWDGLPLGEMIMYELHIGTFTPQGTFEAACLRLDDLADLGVNTVEIMPVAQFPGDRNWGYDGVYPFAVQTSYGGPSGLKLFVNECHKRNMAAIVDVVYNHLGPEGNYLWDYGPYFTDRYRTPWGQAVNFDGPYSNEVRNFFIQNALFWFEHYHIDGLRLDALHAIHDMSARHFLLELSRAVNDFSATRGRKCYLIAEDDRNNPALVRDSSRGGYGLDAQWCDDYHHALHTLLTGEKEGYYIDFEGINDLATSLKSGYVYSGRYSPYRKRNHGASAQDIPADRMVVFSQNHDQIGNRMLGERLSRLISFDSLKIAAGMIILSPYIPLLFMGEEYGESAPFLYFVSHSDPELITGVREGRKREFSAFRWKGEPPDPQSEEAFLTSKLSWDSRGGGNNRVLLDYYRELISVRRSLPALCYPDRSDVNVKTEASRNVMMIRRSRKDSLVVILCNFGSSSHELPGDNIGAKRLKKIVDSREQKWGGGGSSLPDIIETGKNVSIGGETFAVFTEEGR